MKFLIAITLAMVSTVGATPLIKDILATGLRDPMEIAISPDGDFYVAEREGRVLRINPNTGGIFEIGVITVEALRSKDPQSNYAREDGLLGIALDPKFAKNQRLFLFYSAPDMIANRLSRFTLKDGKIDSASELKILEIPTERTNKVCHHGGSVEFGPDGLLYVSIGDNTNPFESKGYAPIDNRDGRVEWDAQRSAGNTNDLRGKIIRIKPTESGYEIPPGNLFPNGTKDSRPEIYIMGCRNPFRISIDPKTKTLYWGEVGPDARDITDKGPLGYDEVNQAKAAGNFGWPFVIADNKPYSIVDFTNNTAGKMIDPAAPENLGQRNTGLKILPPAQPSLIWYPYVKSEEFPAMGEGGRNAMAGPVFYYEPSKKYNILGKHEDHTLLTYEWMRGKIFKAKLDAAEQVEKLEVLMENLVHPMDLEMDHDGSLVLLEYGADWYFNGNGTVSRLRPDDGNKPPTIAIKLGAAPNSYVVDQAADPENGKISVTWYLTEGAKEKNLGTGSTVTIPEGIFEEIRAVATDNKGAIAIARIPIAREEELPSLALELGKTEGKPGFGDFINFKITSNGSPDPAKIKVRARYIPPTGHDSGGPELPTEAARLATASQCLACHQVDSGVVGPSYLDVALRYSDRADASAYLTETLRSGSTGVWGDIPMPPQVALKPEDSDKLIAAILGLSQGITETRGTLSGTIRLSSKFGAEFGGAWEISANAPGYDPAKTRIPAK